MLQKKLLLPITIVLIGYNYVSFCNGYKKKECTQFTSESFINSHKNRVKELHTFKQNSKLCFITIYYLKEIDAAAKN